MKQIFVYGDSLSWGFIPGTRQRLPFAQRWPGVLEIQLNAAGQGVRIIEDCLNGRRTVLEDPIKAGRNGLAGIGQRMEVNSPLALAILMLGINDFQSMYTFTAWHSAQGIAGIVRAMRAAPIEPGMPVPPILIVSPPPITTLAGDSVIKYAGAEKKCAGLAGALRAVAETEGCSFFDAGSVARLSAIDGIHLDADQQEILGRALTGKVTEILSQNAASAQI
ncbi:MAG TPA: SGNH/GDSL hydrolase family protein [Pseudomonadales bacterium]|nr:SGNH/GDSL hydrolase family protein [Pseudomonadales bacterium]